MSTVPARRAPGRGVLLPNTDWRTYSRLLRVFAERPAIRLAYDRGVLEIVSPLYRHEGGAYLLGRFVDALTEERKLPVKGGRSTTLRSRRKRRGLEPDCCYWIASEPQVRGKQDIDLRTDPPPDLAVEIDVTRSSLDRLGIYAALGVPEVWQLEGGRLTLHLLQADGTYAAGNRSRAFPFVTATDLTTFLARQGTQDDNAVVADFRAWIRQHSRTSGAGPSAVP